MIVALIGQTGCGKTTLAKGLMRRLGIPRIASGDIARELGHQDKSTKLALDRGLFAPEEAMRIQMRQRIEMAQLQSGGCVIEGFPRTIAQCIALLSWTTATPTFINLDCPRMQCIHRLIERGRDDDNPDALSRKFEIFDESTWPMLELLGNAGLLHRVSADQAPERVLDNALAVVVEVSA